MKRVVSLLLSCMIFLCSLALAEQESLYAGVWIETEGYGTLTILADGTALMEYFDGTLTSCHWEHTDAGAVFTDGMWYNSPMTLLDDNTLSVSNGWMIFAREGFLPTTDEALLLAAEPVGKEGLPFLGAWELTSLIIEEEVIEPDLFGMTMTLTFYGNGLVTSDDGLEPYTTTWFMSYGNAVVEGDVLFLDDNDQLNFSTVDGTMVFTRALTAETDPANPADPVPVGEEGAQFLGMWILESMLIDGAVIDPGLFGMTMTLSFSEDGTVIADDGSETETISWYAENGTAIADGMVLTINAENKLVMEEEGASMFFVHTDSANSPQELSEEEQLLALMQLLEIMGGVEEDPCALPEHHQGFVGNWHLCYIISSGLTGDLRPLGISSALTLNADYTGIITGIATEEGTWYENEDGLICFGESSTPLFLIGEKGDEQGFFLQYGTEAGGCMIFHQDAEASWVPGLHPLQTPASNADSGAPTHSGSQLLTDVKYVCTSYTTAGITLDASTLGAEYAVIFTENGTASFTLAGFNIPTLSYTISDGQYVIDYYGTPFTCIPTDDGFNMDYYGTMTMHFVPAG